MNPQPFIAAISEAKGRYYYVRAMMNIYWPNPFKNCPTDTREVYNDYRNEFKQLNELFNELNIPLYPRKGF